MNIPSKIFLDGGDPQETRQADQLLKQAGLTGIEGQTTNPTLVAKNPEVQVYLAKGKRLTRVEALDEYKKIVQSIAKITSGPVSIQVIGDQHALVEDMLQQARVYQDWIPNGVVKFPITGNGLAAAEIFCQEWSVNLTLNFSQEQAAAVYSATKNAKHQVFISPFAGRLDDRGENGMDVVKNIITMYQNSNHHVKVLTASVRKIEHLLYALQLKSNAVTVPLKIIQEWVDQELLLPDKNFLYNQNGLKPIPYQSIILGKDWRDYDIHHELTDLGVEKFMQDWRSII